MFYDDMLLLSFCIMVIDEFLMTPFCDISWYLFQQFQ